MYTEKTMKSKNLEADIVVAGVGMAGLPSAWQQKDAKVITMKNGKPATQGIYPACGTRLPGIRRHIKLNEEEM